MSKQTYEERKAAAREKIMCMEVYLSTHSVSWAELADMQAKIETLARKNGLTQELRENGLL